MSVGVAGRRIYLAGFLIAGPCAHSHAVWRHPRSQLGGFLTPQYYARIAQSLEQGIFDLLFFADRVAVSTRYGDDPAFGLERGDQDSTRLDPLLTLAVMSAATQRIGLGATVSTTYAQPYSLARSFATLDHLSGGRAAWNVVTSVNTGEAENFGHTESLDHDSRYDRADEFMEATEALWRGWSPEALLLDRDSGRYADASKVASTHYHGRWIHTRGPLNIPCSPQGSPVIIQAGSSSRGQDFAARWSELVFSIQPDVQRMQRFYTDFKSRVEQQGRKPADARVLTCVMPFVGRTREEAEDLRELHNATVDPLVGLSTLSSHMNVDFSRFDLDTPVEHVDVQGMQGMFNTVRSLSLEKSLTLRDVGRLYGRGVLVPQVTGTPRQVADELIALWEADATDGFVITPAHLPEGFTDFVEGVVPEFQRVNLLPRAYAGSTLRDHLAGGRHGA